MTDLPPTPSSDTRLPREIWVLVASGFIIALGYGIISPVLPRFAASFDVTVTASSAVVSAFALSRLIFAPVGGFLTSRLGERWVYLTGVAIVAISTGAVAFANSYHQLLLFRGLGGIGSVMFTVSSTTLVIRVSPPRARGKAGAAMGSSFLIGGMAGPAVGAALSGLGMRTPFIIYMAALLAACLIVATMLPRVPRGEVRSAPTLPVMSIREALRDSAYRAVLTSGFANGWANIGMRNAIIPLFAMTLVGAGEWAPGAMLTVAAVGSAAVLPLAGSLVDRGGRRLYAAAGLGGLAVFTALQGFSHSIWIALVVIGLTGVSGGFFQPAQQAALADIIGNKRSGSSVTALYSMVLDLGAIIGPLAAGAIVDYLDYSWAFAAAAALMAVASLHWLSARETRPS